MVIQTIIDISKLIGAITVIIGALITIEKWSKGKISNWLLKSIFERFEAIDKAIKDTRDHLKKIERDNLKVIIMSEEIPIEERLQAGERYIELGGNSVIKIHYNELKRKYESKIKKEV